MNKIQRRNAIRALLLEMDREELTEINRLVVEMVRDTTRRDALSYRPEDRVEWQSKRAGVLIQGTVVRVNKNVTVRADDGMLWRVSPSFLSHVA